MNISQPKLRGEKFHDDDDDDDNNNNNNNNNNNLLWRQLRNFVLNVILHKHKDFVSHLSILVINIDISLPLRLFRNQ